MDKTTIPGLVFGIGALLAGGMMEGSTPDKLMMLPAFVIVMGGTLGTILVSFPLSVVSALPKYLTIAIKDKPHDLNHVVETFVRLADRARREGLLALEQEASALEPFTRRGIQMVVDGTDPALVREILESDIDAMRERHKPGAAMFEAMGGYSPTMGIIGTVMGLVHVLENLSQPDELGPLIAGAFIATLYGVAFANCFYLPLATKLKGKSGDESHLKQLIVEGVLAVQAGDNPRVVREKLEAYLAPKLRGGAEAGRGAAATDAQRAAA
ncbi:MAG: flagellar motor protein [Chloroflexi bacterium]|nr:flagellar motor protein [Chloroflexota bacterium]